VPEAEDEREPESKKGRGWRRFAPLLLLLLVIAAAAIALWVLAR
jgi:hypothetical protein